MRVPRASVANGFSLVSAFFSLLPLSCCVFPVALSFLGASGLAFAAALTPYRSYFVGLTLISLGAAFSFPSRPQKNCAPEGACAARGPRRFQVVFLCLVPGLVRI